MDNLPSGTVTFLFTDIEGSTKLWEKHPEAMRPALAKHDSLLRSVCLLHQGYIFKTMGDAFYVAFASPTNALQAAIHAQQVIQGASWGETIIKVRMALHCGQVETRDNDYFGQPLNRVARLLSTGHGGQVLLSIAVKNELQNDLPQNITLRDMGERRLRDLLRPEHIFQLIIPQLQNEFAPLKTLDTFRTNLPAQLTSFIGREKEMVEVKKLLSQSRLVTLTGVGGTGKTRLSLQVASSLIDDFPGGVYFVELASVTNPDLVAQAVASALQLHELGEHSMQELITEFLGVNTVLLLLDNCEHLIQTCAELVSHLLQHCPKLQIMATSREPLSVTGEAIWSVTSFSSPQLDNSATPDLLRQFDAVKLFVDRARAVLPNFDLNASNGHLIAQICTRLDGIPLAIELAAARVRGMGVEQIVARLDSRFRLLTGGNRTALPRQKTLRALIDWSYDILQENERLLLRRLSVFSGGWTLESAEEICGSNDILISDVLEVLTQLVNKSLVLVVDYWESGGSTAPLLSGSVRYRMLETVHEYTSEKLFTSGETETIRRLHAQHFLKLAEKANQQRHTPEHAKWLNRLTLERGNLNEALRWTSASDELEMFLRLTESLWFFWAVRGPLAEGRIWSDQAVRACEAAGPAVDVQLLVGVLGGASELARAQDDYEQAVQWKQKVRELCQQSGDEGMAAATMNDLAIMYANHGEAGRGLDLAKEAVTLRRKLGRPLGIAHALQGVSFALICLNDITAAGRVTQEAMQIARELQNPEMLMAILGFQALISLRQEDYDDVIQNFRESLAIIETLQDQDAYASFIYIMGTLAALEGNAARAARLLGRAEEIARQGGFRIEIPGQPWIEHMVSQAKTQMDEMTWNEEFLAGRSMTTEQAIQLALEGYIK